MRKFLLLSIIILSSFWSSAQLVFEINQPSHLKGIYPSIPPSTAWNSPNLYINGTWFSDTVVISNDGINASACSPIINNVNNQYALFYRYGCNLDDQLLNAQAAGATGAIIIDSVVGRPLPFPSEVQSASITIPFVIISLDEGDSLIAAINLGETSVVSFGDKTGTNTVDLGIYMETSIWSSYGYFHLNTTSYFTDTLLGAWIYNHGTADVNNVQLRFYLKGKTSSIDLETISLPVTIPVGDSIYVPISFQNIVDFSIEPDGLNYGYSILLSDIDEDTLDNEIMNSLLFYNMSSSSLESLLSPSFFNNQSTLSDFDFLLSGNPAYYYVIGYRGIFNPPNCIISSSYGYVSNFFTEVLCYFSNFGSYDGFNFYSGLISQGPLWTVNFPNTSLTIYNHNFINDPNQSFYDTVGVTIEFLGTLNFAFTTDMYHDEKRRRYPEEKVLFYIDNIQSELDPRLTPCSYFVYGNVCWGGLNENDKNDIKLFPNPSNGVFEIQTKINLDKMEVIDVTGKICSQTLFNSIDSFYQCNLKVVPGYYTLIFYTSDNKVIRTPIIINQF